MENICCWCYEGKFNCLLAKGVKNMKLTKLMYYRNRSRKGEFLQPTLLLQNAA